MVNKIALEEHYSDPATTKYFSNPATGKFFGEDYYQFIANNLWGNVAEYADDLRQTDTDHAVMSINGPGVQAVTDASLATEMARASNDAVNKAYVQPYPDRFSAFATVALQDPQAAADELDRAVTQLGMKGALINGFSDLPNNQVAFLDDPAMDVFWAKAVELRVPVYLHPRSPHSDQAAIYAGYPGLTGSAWGYTQETAVQVIRLMMSGLFDRYPDLQLIVGHLAEGLPYNLPRTQERLYKQNKGTMGGHYDRPLMDYLRTNVWATTSGHFNTSSFMNALDVMGADHLMFSVDWPYETNKDGATWFDQLPIDLEVKQQIGAGNAAKLLKIK